MLLTCSYKEQEFFRCGYYVNNFYENEEWNVTPPEKVQLDKLKRHILFDKPRITKFNISWDQPKTQVASYNNYMFNDDNYNNIQNEFKNIDYNNFNNNVDVNSYKNAFMQGNQNANNEDNTQKIFQELMNENKQK